MLTRLFGFLTLPVLLLSASPPSGDPTVRDDELRVDALGDPLESGVLTRLGSTRLLHAAKITGLGLTAAGDLVASGSLDGEVRVWSAVDGTELFAQSLGEGGVRSLSISADGERVAAGSTAGFALVWNWLTREQILRVDGGALVALAPDGRTLAVAGADDELQIVELDSDASLKVEGIGFQPTTLAFSPDGTRIVKTVWNKERAKDGDAPMVAAALEMYAREDGKLLWRVTYGEPNVKQPAFAKNGRELLVVDDGGNLIRYDARTGDELGRGPEIEGCIYAAAAGTRVVTLSTDGTVQTWDGVPEERKRVPTNGASPSACALSADAGVLSLALGSEVCIWTLPSCERRVSFARDVTPVATVAWLPDGDRIVTGSFGGEIRLWDASNGRPVAVVAEGLGRVFEVAASPDGSVVGGVDWNGGVQLWNAETRELVASFFESDSSTTGFDFSPDGKRVAIGSADGVLRVVDVETGEQVLRGEDIVGTAVWVKYSPDGKQIAVGARDLMIVDAETGDAQRRWERLGSPLNAIAWSPDGTRLAVGLSARHVRLYDTTSEAPPRELHGHAGRVNAVAFTPSGSVLLSGGYGESVVRAWNASSGAPLGELRGYTSDVLSLAVSPDGSRVAVGGLDANTLVLDLSTLAAPVRHEGDG